MILWYAERGLKPSVFEGGGVPCSPHAPREVPKADVAYTGNNHHGLALRESVPHAEREDYTPHGSKPCFFIKGSYGEIELLS